MTHSRQDLGRDGEILAEKHLKQHGYRILERNYRTRLGEIDIIASHEGTLVFVEVKTRRSRHYGPAKASLSAAKRRRLSMLALLYLKQNRSGRTRARFDVVAIDTRGADARVEIIANAFELAYPD